MVSVSRSSVLGMAGRTHAAAYRTASALYNPVLPPIRLVSIGDVNAEFGSLAARRFGYERNDTSWQAIAESDDIDVVSVVIANSLHRKVVEGLLVFCENGAARFDQRRPAEIELFLSEGKGAENGYRQVILGPDHPYLAGGLAMDAPSVGFGQNDDFAYQARAFLEEVAGIDQASSLPRCATFDEGVHNMELLAAVAKSAGDNGKQVSL